MLIEFLTDVVSNMENFRDDITTIYIFKEGYLNNIESRKTEKGQKLQCNESNIVAVGNHPKMLVFYRVEPKEDLINAIPAPTYLGALQYLRSLLGSPLMKGGSIHLEYQEKNGAKVYTKSMRFFSGRIDSHFECTNPELINQSERRTKFDKPMDAVIFSFTKEMRKEFDEVARMNTPKSDSRLFNLVFDGTYMRAVFGSGKHTTSLILTDKVTGNTDTKIQKLIFLERFKPIIKLVSDNGGQLSFHEKVLWASFDTNLSRHLIAIPTIRQQN